MNQIEITHIPLKEIEPSATNPRKTFDQAAIIELAETIKEHGVLQPILVRKSKSGKTKYEVVAGERRYRASIIVQGAIKDRTTIPATIRELTDDQVLEIQIIENLQRKDVHPMEEAVGFKGLVAIKKMDVKEIATRVGKSPQYVAQRIKLNDLIPDMQKVFYDGKLKLVDAMKIYSLAPADQKELHKNIADTNGVYNLNSYELNKYTRSLLKASFPTEDPKLIKTAGACSGCSYNSAFNTILFPDQVNNPTCSNAKCFQTKTETSFAVEFKKAQADPDIVLINTSYYGGDSLKKLQKEHDVLDRNQYDEEDKPEVPDREDFDDNNDTEAEDEKEFQESLLDYNKEIAEYNKKIASGKFIKAFVVLGDDKGQYLYVKLKKAVKNDSKPVALNGPAANESADIKSEIVRIQDREKRQKELDGVKIWTELYPNFNPTKNTAAISKPKLTPLEIEAVAKTILNKLNYTKSADFRKQFKIKNDKFTGTDENTLRQMLRFFMLSELPTSQINYTGQGDSALCIKVAGEYFPDQLKKITAAQNEIVVKRVARVAEKIKGLQTKLKNLSKPRTLINDTPNAKSGLSTLLDKSKLADKKTVPAAAKKKVAPAATKKKVTATKSKKK